MVKIVAIGGGEIGRLKEGGGNYPIQTRKIDKRIIELTGKKSPRVLFLPTASGDSTGYYSTFENYYGKLLGCKTDVLYLVNQSPSLAEMKRKINSADILYVGGGNTLKMLKIWRRKGLDKILINAAENGKVLCGLSAGAICWFKYGNSDSMKFGPSRSAKLIRLKGLDLVSTMACPHYDVEVSRRPELQTMIKKYGGSAIALENCSALEFIDGTSRIITSSPNAKAYRVYKKEGIVIEESLPKNKFFQL